MATETKGLDLSFRASADLSAKQHTIMKINEAGAVTFAAANTDLTNGILQNKPADDRAASVRVTGISKLVAGGTITVGAHITADSAGRGIATTTDGDNSVGYALEACDAAGEVITCLVQPHTVYIA
jgi:hypothetical protein